MATIELCDWEQNGYHDSYFYAAVYDAEAKAIKAVETGSTAFAGGFHSPGVRVGKDDPILVEAYEALERAIRARILEAGIENHERPQPDAVHVGTTVEVVKATRCVAKETEPCRRCEGTGLWANPRNPEDKRSCLTCGGTGEKVVKATNGEKAWLRIPAGTLVTVSESKPNKRLYSRAPGREDITLVGKLEDGTRVQVALANVRRPGPAPVLTSEIRERAHKLACEGQFQAATGVRCAWLSGHFAPCPETFRQQRPLAD